MREALICMVIIGACYSSLFAANQADLNTQLYRDIEQSGIRIETYHSDSDNQEQEFGHIQSQLLTKLEENISGQQVLRSCISSARLDNDLLFCFKQLRSAQRSQNSGPDSDRD